MTIRSFLALAALAVGGLAQDSPPFPLSNSSDPAAAGATGTGTGLVGTGTGTPTSASIPAGVTPNQGAFTITQMAAECTAAAAPFQTGFWVSAPQLAIEDDGNWWGTADHVPWTFWTNTSGVILSKPFYTMDGPNTNTQPNITSSNGSAVTIDMDKAQTGTNLVFDIATGDPTSASNDTSNATTLKARDTPIPIPFFLNIEGAAPCAHPVGNTSCSENSIQRTTDQWKAYGVDDFLSNWIKNNSDAFTNNKTSMIQKFVTDFNIGSGAACTFTEPCKLVEVCNELPNGGKDDDSPKIYLALIALQNLSDLMHRMWQALSISEADTLTQIARLAYAFNQINSTTVSTTPSPFWTASSSLSLASAVLAFVPGGAAITPAITLAGAVSAMVYAGTAAKSTTTWPSTQAEGDYANVATFLGDFVSTARSGVEDTYNKIFNEGVNVTTLLKDGALVNRTDLQVDCSTCDSHQEAWMEQTLALKTINEIWLHQNVFITFMPYGEIRQVDTFEVVNFTESDCASNFLKTELDRNTTICNTDGFGWNGFLGPGMARLNWYNDNDTETIRAGLNGAQGWGKVNLSNPAPGLNNGTISFNSTEGNGYTFQPLHALESSLRGFIKGGQGYDALADQASAFANPYGNTEATRNQSAMAVDIFNLNATSAGMFNIPVCHIRDLNRWPTYWSSDGRLGGDYYSACADNLDFNGRKFEDFVGPQLKYLIQNIMHVDGSSQPIGPGYVIGETPAVERRNVRHPRARKDQPFAPVPSRNGA